MRRSRKSRRRQNSDDADVQPLAALDARDDAQHRVGERLARSAAGMLGLLDERARRREARGEKRGEVVAAGAGSAPSQTSGTSATARRRPPARAAASRSSASRIGPASGEQDVLGRASARGSCAVSASGRSPCWRKNAAPWSMSQVLLAPDEQVRVAVRAVDVRHERVEPDDVGREPGRRAGRPAA